MQLKKYEKEHTEIRGYTCIGYGSIELGEFAKSIPAELFTTDIHNPTDVEGGQVEHWIIFCIM